MLRLLLPSFLGLALFACGSRQEAGLHIVVGGPLTPTTDFDRLSVIARLAEEGTPLSVEVFQAAELQALPVTMNLLSGPGTPEGTRIEVFASAELDGVVRSAVRGEGELTRGEGSRITLELPPLPSQPEGGSIDEVCTNGLDDDADGLADCADPDCDALSCSNEGGLTCGAGACGCPSGAVGVYATRSGFAPAVSPLVTMLRAGPRAGQVAIGASPLSQVQFFDPVTVQLESLNVPGAARLQPALGSTADGRVVVTGGVGESSVSALSALGDQFITTTFTSMGQKLVCEGASSRGLGDRVILVGGRLGKGNQTPVSNGVFAAGAGTFEKLGEVGASCLQSLAPIGTDALLIVGGCIEGSTPQPATHVALLVGSALQTGPSLPVALAAPAVATLSSGRALIVGGILDAAGEGSDRAFLVERASTGVSLRELPPMSTAMGAPRAASLPNGWVFIADAVTGRALWFDAASEIFLPAPSIPEGRTEFGVVGLLTNHALIVGGQTGGAPSTSALIVSPGCQ